MNPVESGRSSTNVLLAKAIAATLCSAGVATAYAQAPQTGAGLEEIVVTARKVEERLQDVPLTVTAISSQQIEELRITSPEDIARYTPGFSYVASFGRNNAERPVIRGQSNILGDPNASFFVDGIYLSGPAVSTEIGNLERVEIIKGPQSALYGRATFAGAINYVTRRPTDEFEGDITLTGAEHEEYDAKAWISGPLVSDRLYFYLGARHWEYGGEYKNEITGKDVGGQQTDAASAKLLWKVTDNFEATLFGSYSEDDDEHAVLSLQGREFNNCYPRGAEFPRARGYFCGEVLGADDLRVRLKTDLFPDGGGVQRERWRSALTLNWDLGGYTLTSISAYNDEDQATEYDVSYYGYDAFAALFNPGGFWRLEAEDREDFSQELRLRSPGDRRFRWLLGGYYFDGSDDRTRNDKVLPNGTIVPNSPNVTSTKDVENIAVFGGLEFDFTEKFTGTLELRYAEDTIEQTLFDPAAPTEFYEETYDSTKPRVTLRYKPNDDASIYFNFAQGNKPGGFNTGFVSTIPGVPTAYDEEESDNYELGAKLTALDGRVSLNVATYYIKLTNQQLTNTAFTINPMTGVGTANSYIENVGETEIKGVEIEYNMLLTENWDLSLGLSYTNAEITRYLSQDQADLTSPLPASAFNIPNCPSAEACAALAQADLEEYGDVSGNRPPRAPEFQGFLVTRYGVPMSNGWEWFIGGDVTYEGSKYAQVHNLAETGSRTYLGARTGFKGDRWTIELWGKNLTDDDTALDILRYVDMQGIETFPQYIANGRYVPRGFVMSLPRGRQVGLTVDYRF
jgi:iron complex outermembrane receptor protein